MSAMREQMNVSKSVSTPMDRMYVLVELDTDFLQMATTALVSMSEYLTGDAFMIMIILWCFHNRC